jgi:adenine deaminase
MPNDLNVAISGVTNDPNRSLQVTTEGTVATYGVAAVGITPAATPTDIVIISGSATKTVRVKQVIVSGVATTAGSMDVSLIKRTAANTGGTSTAPSIAKFDAGDAAASAVVTQYSANASALGAGVAIATKKLNLGLAGDAGVVVFDFANRNDKPVILRGVAQGLAINFNGGAVPAGGSITYSVEFEEDAS